MIFLHIRILPVNRKKIPFVASKAKPNMNETYLSALRLGTARRKMCRQAPKRKQCSPIRCLRHIVHLEDQKSRFEMIKEQKSDSPTPNLDLHILSEIELPIVLYIISYPYTLPAYPVNYYQYRNRQQKRDGTRVRAIPGCGFISTFVLCRGARG